MIGDRSVIVAERYSVVFLKYVALAVGLVIVITGAVLSGEAT